MIVNLLLWLILGALAGWIASKIMGTSAQQGLTLNIVVGIVGAFLGGILMNLLGFSGTTGTGTTGAGTMGFDIYSLLVAIVGAVILLAIVKAVRGSGSSTPPRT